MMTASSPRYSCGTLLYTRRGVILLFCWLLWGDFCLVLLENTRPAIVPLLLKAHDASNFVIGLLCGSIPALLNFIVNPIISTASDRTRTRFGRRIPYLIGGVPFVSLFLILLGYSDSIGMAFARLATGGEAGASAFIIAVLGLFSIGFVFFDLFAGCVYYYLFSDVVPRELIGRFMGFFRMAGSCGGLAFNLAIMPYVKTHMTIVCVIVGIIYIIGFGGMCLNVREGTYEPPPPVKPGVFSNIGIYFKECFSLPYWVILFLGLGLNYASTVCRGLFNLLYAMENLHLTTAQYGQIMACGSVISIAISIPVGILIDRYHSIRIYIAAAWLVILVNFFGFFFCTNFLTFFVTSMCLTVVYVMQTGARLPLAINLFPKEQFGQFSSANSMVKAILMVSANALGGWFIDLLGYQYLFIWDLLFTLLSVLILHWIYFRWKKLGGDTAYRPPLVSDVESATPNPASQEAIS